MFTQRGAQNKLLRIKGKFLTLCFSSASLGGKGRSTRYHVWALTVQDTLWVTSPLFLPLTVITSPDLRDIQLSAQGCTAGRAARLLACILSETSLSLEREIKSVTNKLVILTRNGSNSVLCVSHKNSSGLTKTMVLKFIQWPLKMSPFFSEASMVVSLSNKVMGGVPNPFFVLFLHFLQWRCPSFIM